MEKRPDAPLRLEDIPPEMRELYEFAHGQRDHAELPVHKPIAGYIHLDDRKPRPWRQRRRRR